ncbi:MAG: cupin domain-containing protein [Betaproteobacteria bacterium]|nr:cupin domain-containing protein [Betaproteobacteria bacterium]
MRRIKSVNYRRPNGSAAARNEVIDNGRQVEKSCPLSRGFSYTVWRPSWIEAGRGCSSGVQRDGPHWDSERASNVARYDPCASFGSHEHASGEEFLILSGTFADETGE